MEKQITASDFVLSQLLKFGKSMVWAAIPSAVDGFKPVFRRLLVANRDTHNGGGVTGGRLIGDTIELHPYGDASIYNAAARLAQNFEYIPPLMTFVSNSGTYGDPDPAASRYAKGCKISEFAHDVFFKTIEYRALPKTLTESLEAYEPAYLIPVIPTALLYANSAIGYGEGSHTIPHNLTDVCDLAVAFCKHMLKSPISAFDYAPHAEKFLPDFPIVNTLTNHKQIVAAYRRGDFNYRITMDGEVELTSDTIIVRTLAYGNPVEELEGKIQDLMRAKGEWFDKNIDYVRSASSKQNDMTNVVIKLKRGVNVFEAWDRIKPKILFSGSFTPKPNYNQQGYATQISQARLLDVWYQARYNILISSKKIKITNTTDSVRKVDALLIVIDDIPKFTALVTAAANKHEGILKLQEVYGLTFYQANYLIESPFSTATNASRVELQQRRARLQQELIDIQTSFSKIPEEMIKEINDIKKKYATPRKTIIPYYIGYVKLGGGCIQIDTVDNIPSIIEAFPKVDLEIHIYDGPHLYQVTESKKLIMGSIPKITTGDIYGLGVDLETNPRSGKVITVNIADGVACCVKGFIPGLRSEGYFYTTPISKAIYRNGDIRTITITDEISVRKTISKGAQSNIIYVYPDSGQDHYVIALNTSTLNLISIQKISPEKAKLAINPQGNVYLIHATSKHFFLNVPPAYLHRSSIRVIELLDIEQILEGKLQIRLDIASAKVKSHKHIRLL